METVGGGEMTWVVTAVVVSGVSTVASIYGQQQSAKAQEIELDIQADQEKMAAQSRELQRRQRLNKALAANAVGQAMSGIRSEGTPQSIALESAKQISISENVEKLSDRLKQAQMKRQGKNIRSAANVASASTLLSGAADIASIKMGG